MGALGACGASSMRWPRGPGNPLAFRQDPPAQLHHPSVERPPWVLHPDLGTPLPSTETTPEISSPCFGPVPRWHQGPVPQSPDVPDPTEGPRCRRAALPRPRSPLTSVPDSLASRWARLGCLDLIKTRRGWNLPALGSTGTPPPRDHGAFSHPVMAQGGDKARSPTLLTLLSLDMSKEGWGHKDRGCHPMEGTPSTGRTLGAP